MVMREVYRIVLYGLGIGSISAIVYLAGPFVAFGDYRPLESYIIRDVVILLLVTAAASLGGANVWKRLRGARVVAEGVSAGTVDEGDAPVLEERMKDALSTLKAAGKGRATYLYDLPWYLLIGPPGSGKTTALVNSGLKFPLAGGGRPAAVAGVGGTRYCDWWFTEDAVLIDTAGRYTTQDSDAKADARSWFAFLDMLKKGRPKQPINGVLLAISVSDVLTMSASDLAAHATAIRARLLELHTRLKVDFPVYALFTKADLILGFTEFFQNLDTLGRAQVFGATFQTADKTANLVGQVPAEFDALLESLNVEMLDRLQDEPAPVTRVQLYGFPTQLAALKRPLFDFLNQIFEPTRYHAAATLRGFYLTSGTQEGTPIDQLIGALERSFGTVELAPSAYSGQGKSYFLTNLLKTVIIGESGWVSTDLRAVRRAAVLKAVAYAALLIVCAGLAGLWWISYGRNQALIDRTKSEVAALERTDESLMKQTAISDHDLARILPLLGRIRDLPTGYAERGEPVPVVETFGLSQHDRIQSAAIRSYHVALERLFRPRLLYRLEEVLETQRNDPGAVYAALKVYKMLGGQQAIDVPLVLDWERHDWADNLYAGGQDDSRQALENHLRALLDLDDGHVLVTLSQPLLERSEAALAQLSIAQRAYQLLKSQGAGRVADWSLVRQVGPQVGTVFEPAGAEPLSAIHVASFYTYDGFRTAFLGRLGQIAEQVDKERWVLGDQAKQTAVAEQYATLQRDLLGIYSLDYIRAWQEMLKKIRIRRMSSDKTYVALTAAASPTSPIKQLFESIVDQTALTRPPKPGSAADIKPSPDAAPALLEGAPGASVEEAFKAYDDMMAGDPGHRPIDQLLRVLGNIAGNLKQQASSPSDRPPAQHRPQAPDQRPAQSRRQRAGARRRNAPIGSHRIRRRRSADRPRPAVPIVGRGVAILPRHRRQPIPLRQQRRTRRRPRRFRACLRARGAPRQLFRAQPRQIRRPKPARLELEGRRSRGSRPVAGPAAELSDRGPNPRHLLRIRRLAARHDGRGHAAAHRRPQCVGADRLLRHRHPDAEGPGRPDGGALAGFGQLPAQDHAHHRSADPRADPARGRDLVGGRHRCRSPSARLARAAGRVRARRQDGCMVSVPPSRSGRAGRQRPVLLQRRAELPLRLFGRFGVQPAQPGRRAPVPLSRQPLSRPHAQRPLWKAAGQTRLRRRIGLPRVPARLGGLAAGGLGGLLGPAGHGVEGRLPQRTDMALLAGCRDLRRAGHGRIYAVGRRRRPIFSADGLRAGGGRRSCAAGVRAADGLVHRGRGPAAVCTRRRCELRRRSGEPRRPAAAADRRAALRPPHRDGIAGRHGPAGSGPGTLPGRLRLLQDGRPCLCLFGDELLVDGGRRRLSRPRSGAAPDARPLLIPRLDDRRFRRHGQLRYAPRPTSSHRSGPMDHPTPSRFASAADTHPGRTRSQNEDAHLVREEAGLWAVADGMGGHHAGEFASRTVIDALAAVQPQPSAALLLAQCESCVVDANARVRAVSTATGETIGTTLAVLLVHEANYACVWSGDSRIYRVRDGMLALMSRDHTQVQDMIDNGLLSAEEGRVSPYRNVITRAIGVSPEAELEIAGGLLRDGDLFLLCTDGLTTHVADDELAAGLADNVPGEACRHLLNLALERGGTDNVTLVITRYGGPGAPSTAASPRAVETTVIP